MTVTWRSVKTDLTDNSEDDIITSKPSFPASIQILQCKFCNTHTLYIGVPVFSGYFSLMWPTHLWHKNSVPPLTKNHISFLDKVIPSLHSGGSLLDPHSLISLRHPPRPNVHGLPPCRPEPQSAERGDTILSERAEMSRKARKESSEKSGGAAFTLRRRKPGKDWEGNT